MSKRVTEPVKSEFDAPPFIPTTMEAARQSDGLVWWRPDGVISATPESDVAMVRLG
jgi:hypothetical protein